MINRNKLKERRKLLKYTQEDMQKLTGINRVTYTKIETGRTQRIALQDAFIIAKVLHSTIEDLFDADMIEAFNDLRPTGTQE